MAKTHERPHSPEISNVDFNAPHNVWRAATGELIMSEASMDLKLPIVKRCKNFKEASEYCKNNK